VISDVRRIVGNPEYVPSDPRELCDLLFVTCYMGTENSSDETRTRAERLAEQIGRYRSTNVAE
jgi:NAD+ synthase (glutamine-hydrolysing)